jgi:quercetin dioxygenase-like cupin family protein
MFKSQKPAKVILIVLATLLVANASLVSAQNTTTLSKTILLEQSVELTSSTINTKTIRVSFPVGFKTPWHTHEGPGPRYVVKGKLQVVEGGKTNTYSSGDVFWETGSLMSVENTGKDTAELIIFELTSAH